MNCDFCNFDDPKPCLLLLKEHGGKEVRLLVCQRCAVKIGKFINKKLNPPKGV